MNRRAMVWAWTGSFVVLAGFAAGCNEEAVGAAGDVVGGDSADAVVPSGEVAVTTAGTHASDVSVVPDVPQPTGCDKNGFTAISQAFEKEPEFAHLMAQSSPNGPFDALSIEIYTSSDYTGGATGPGTYSLADSNYATCANCVVLRQGCGPSGCDRIFYADVGSLVITEYDAKGEHFRGYLDQVIAREVKIDANTYLSTPVEGGKTWCLGGVPFEGAVVPLPVSDKTQPACVAAGTGTLLHDNVKDLSLKNCNGETVSLHATCGDSRKALWLIGTTGWCTACKQFLADFAKDNGGSIARESVNQHQPGLDMLIFLAEDENSGKPSETFCKAYAAENKLDPAMVLIDSADPAVNIALIDNASSYVEVNGLGNLWQVLNPYLTADSAGSVTTAYPWWGLLRSKNMEYVWSDNAAEQTFEEALDGLLKGN